VDYINTEILSLPTPVKVVFLILLSHVDSLFSLSIFNMNAFLVTFTSGD